MTFHVLSSPHTLKTACHNTCIYNLYYGKDVSYVTRIFHTWIDYAVSPRLTGTTNTHSYSYLLC